MEDIKIKRLSNIYRPLYVNGYQIEKYIFYSDGKILFEFGSCLECEKLGDILSMTITEPKKVNKVNLNRSDNFFITGRREYKFDKSFILYINVNLENIKIEDIPFKERWRDEFKITFYKFKKIILNKPFSYYERSLDENRKLKYVETQKEKGEIILFDKIKNEKLELGLKKDKIFKQFKELNINISSYEIEKLLKNYTLIQKEVKNDKNMWKM